MHVVSLVKLYRYEKLSEFVVQLCRIKGRQVKVTLYKADSQFAYDFQTGISICHCGSFGYNHLCILYGVDMLARGTVLRQSGERYIDAYVRFHKQVDTRDSTQPGNKFAG